MIRLIATDLDDTLLNEKSALTERCLAALRAAMAAGCGVSLSSGRMLEAMLPFAEKIGVNAPMLLYNGAMIYNHNLGETLYAVRVPHALALDIVRLIEAEGFYVQLYPGKGYYCDEVTDYTRAYAKQSRVDAIPVHMPMSLWLEENPSDMQKMLVIDTPEGATRLQGILRAAFPSGASFLKSKPHFIEIVPEGVDKGLSLKRLAEGLGLTPDEVMAFGDGQNDAPMIAYAGSGVAMANACREALDAADIVAPPNTEDGVAQVIEQYLARGMIGAL